MRLKDKIALVTGAASGFGAGIAERFAAEGAKVAVVDINAEGARAEAQKIGANAVAVVADLTKAEEVDRAVGETLAAFGGLDIVVNNAGWTHRNKPILEVTEAEFDRIYAINVKAIYLMTQRTTPVLQGSRRRQRHQHRLDRRRAPAPGPHLVQRLEGFRESRLEVARRRTRALEDPRQLHRAGARQTGLTEDFMGGPATPELMAKFLSTIPLGRMSKPSDIAAACVYLASDEAEFITGVVLPVDGGRTILSPSPACGRRWLKAG